jgi:hypothetical protein
LLAIAACHNEDALPGRRRSMLIHPARERVAHQVAVAWATAAKDEWANALGAGERDPDRLEVVEDFRSYKGQRTTFRASKK